MGSLSHKKSAQPPKQFGPGVMFREGVDSLTRGNAKAALQHFRQILKQSQRNGDMNGVGWSLLHMAMVLRGQREYASGIQILEQARTIFIKSDNKFGLASVFHELSLANRELERNALALEYAHESVKIFQGLGRTLELAWAYDNLAVIHLNLMHRHEILTYAKRARAIFIEFNSQVGLAWNACNLASLYSDMGFYQRAIRYYDEAFKSFTRLGSKQGIAWSLLGKAMVLRSEYNFGESKALLNQSKDIYKELGHKDRYGWCLLNEAAIDRALGDGETALKINKRALQLFGPLRNHDGVAWSLFQIGQIYRDRGQFVKSWQTLREALNLHSDISNRKGMGWAENEWGKTYLELNDQSHARESFIKAKVIAEQLDEGPLKAEVNKNIARLSIEEGLLQRAEELLKQSIQICEKISASETQIDSYVELTRYYLLIGETELAQKSLNEGKSIQIASGVKRLSPLIHIAQGEISMLLGRFKEAQKEWNEAAQLAKKYLQRRMRAEALMGLVQAGLALNDTNHIPTFLAEIEKDVRALSSRRIKAKYLLIKGIWLYTRTGTIDVRLFNQSIQIFSTAGLIVDQKKALKLIQDLYGRANRKNEKKEIEVEIAKFMEKGSVDLHLIRTPLSLGSRPYVSIMS